MRLINTETLLLESFPDLRRTPPYAVLSHTWGSDADEVSLQEMTTPGILASATAAKPGFKKIRRTCQIALKTGGLQYAWVDTCCIDKTSSAELSEAINSMFKWYQQAAICFAFLEDWEPDQPAFDHCRWWRRGWTLQELIAPRDVFFFDRTWVKRGDLAGLCEQISKVSRIKPDVLMKGRALSDVPVAVRMSWASGRETSREEDMAYCLMGIFDINMAMLYGEGPKAFLRLQEEIIKTTPDVSLLAWQVKEDDGPAFMGVLASSPAEFSHCSDIVRAVTWTSNSPELKISISNLGVKTNMFLFSVSGFSVALHGSARLQWTGLVYMDQNELPLGIYLKNVGGSRYVRAWPGLLVPTPLPTQRTKVEQPSSIYLLSRLSKEDSDACTTRQLTLRIHWARLVSLDNMVADLKIEPPESRTQLEMNGCLQVSLDRPKTTVLHFTSRDVEEVSNFLILCRFYILGWGLFASGFWECDVFEADDTMPLPRRVEGREFALSSDGEAPLKVSKTLDLAGGRARRRGRRRAVTVTLEREHTGPESDPVPIFFLDVKMDASNP